MSDGENLQREIASLEQSLRDAVAHTEEAEHQLDSLEERRAAAEGRLAIARRAATDYAARLEDRRQELARALEAEAQARLLEVVAARDEAANRAAEAIAQLIDAFERLDAARAATAERAAETESRLGRRLEVGPEPASFDQEWARLIDFVRARAQLSLEDELVEAAAASPLGHEIANLPEHLQVVARRRRDERMRAASGGEARSQRA
jgi:chromosome segregation ATPase